MSQYTDDSMEEKGTRMVSISSFHCELVEGTIVGVVMQLSLTFGVLSLRLTVVKFDMRASGLL